MTALAGAGVVIGLSVVAPLGTQTVAGAVADGLYTTTQAERGATLYEAQCVACHGAIRQMMPEMAALLADHTFRARWRDRSLGELFELIQIEMPQDAPGTLSNAETAELLAFILQGNRRPAGDVALSDEVDVLRRIAFEPAAATR